MNNETVARKIDQTIPIADLILSDELAIRQRILKILDMISFVQESG